MLEHMYQKRVISFSSLAHQSFRCRLEHIVALVLGCLDALDLVRVEQRGEALLDLQEHTTSAIRKPAVIIDALRLSRLTVSTNISLRRIS